MPPSWVNGTVKSRRALTIGKRSPSPPPAPDPKATADAQAKANIDAILASAAVNRFNTYTPFGSQEYYQSPTGQYAQYITPSGPEAERIALGYGVNNALLGRTAQLMEQTPTNFQFSGLPDVPTRLDMSNAPERRTYIDLSGHPLSMQIDKRLLPDILSPAQYAPERRRIEDTVYARMAEKLSDRFEPEGEALNTRLANQGIAYGSEAYKNAVRGFSQNANEAYRDALVDALTLGGSEFDRAFGQSLSGRQQLVSEQLADAGLMSQARQQELNEQLALAGLMEQARQGYIQEQLIPAQLSADARARMVQEQLAARAVPFQELASLRGVTPTFGLPNFGSPAQYQVAPADVAGAINNNYASRLGTYNQQLANQQSQMNNLYTLGGTLGAAVISDERMKEGIEGTNPDDALAMVRKMPVSEWSYKPEASQAFGLPGGRHIGPMAQDFQSVTGKGDGSTIPTVDAVGMLMAAVQSLANKVDRRAS